MVNWWRILCLLRWAYGPFCYVRDSRLGRFVFELCAAAADRIPTIGMRSPGAFAYVSSRPASADIYVIIVVFYRYHYDFCSVVIYLWIFRVDFIKSRKFERITTIQSINIVKKIEWY